MFGLFTAGVLAENFKIDNSGSHAFVTFKASHLGYSYVLGRFNTFEGAFTYDVTNPSAANVKVTIQSNIVDTNHAEPDKHLRSADYFEAEAYPEITFVSTSFSENSDGMASLTGDFSLHGVSKSTSLNVNHVGHGDDQWGGYRRGLEGSLKIKAADYGMLDWVGGVEVSLTVEGIRQ